MGGAAGQPFKAVSTRAAGKGSVARTLAGVLCLASCAGALVSAARALADPGASAAHTASTGEATTGFAALAHDPPLVPGPTIERAQLSRALAEELAASLRRLPGVTDARVHLLAPAPAMLDAPQSPATASALLLLSPGAPTVDEAAVRSLVAGALPGLAAADVAVVQTHAPASSAPASPGPARAAPTASEPAVTGPVRWVLFGLLFAQLALAAITVTLLRRLRALEALTRR
jgi:type III secretory pathway lipoprotein EscJ